MTHQINDFIKKGECKMSTLKRRLAIFLAVLMICTSVPSSAFLSFAAEETTEPNISTKVKEAEEITKQEESSTVEENEIEATESEQTEQIGQTEVENDFQEESNNSTIINDNSNDLETEMNPTVEENTEETAPVEEKENSQEMDQISADDELSYDGLYYEITNKNEVTITGVVGDKVDCTSVVIPQTIDGKIVTNIGEEAFMDCSGLVSVNLPEGVTSIGSFAFAFCSSLTSINLPDGVTSIGSWAFEYCSSLASIKIPDGVTSIEWGTFDECSSLASVELPEGVTSIEDFAFEYCSSLVGINLPDGVTDIGGDAFALCSSLTSINLPDGVTDIGGGAFYGCSSLESIKLPERITSIEGATFSGCSSLVSIKIPEGVTRIGNEGSAGIGAFSYCSSLASIKIPEGVTIIGDNTFEGCSSLVSVNLPDGVTSIKMDAFYGCSSLASIKIPEGVTYIGGSAFEGCSSLASIKIPEGVTYIGSEVFCDCSSLASIKLPERITSIEWSAFQNCSSLASIKIPEKVTRIGSEAFYGCSSLTSIKILEGVTSVGEDAFYGCKYLTIYGYYDSYAQKYAAENYIEFKSIGVSPNSTSETVLKNLNIDGLLSDSLPEGSFADVSGPIIKVAGKSFPLFKLKVGVDLGDGLLKDVQARVDSENKTVQVLLGFKKFEGSAELSKDKNSDTYWRESYADVKKMYKGIKGNKAGTRKLYNDFRKSRKKLKKHNASMGIDASIYAAGYMELSYATGEFVFREGGMLAEVSHAREVTVRPVEFPVVYGVFGIEGKLEGTLSFVKKSELTYMPALNAEFDLDGKLGIGAGDKKVSNTYVEGGGKLQLQTKLTMPAASLENALLIRLIGKYYLKSKVLNYTIFEYEENIANPWQLYPANKDRIAFDGADVFEINEEQISELERQYGIPVVDTIEQGSKEIFSKSKGYPYGSPKITEFVDGTKLLIWIDDNGTKNAMNRTSLMYSIYDGKSWSNPQALKEAGGINDYPAIYNTGTKAVLMWQRTDKPIADGTDFWELLKKPNLVYVTYANGSFSELVNVSDTGNTALEMMQTIASNGSETAVAWVENSENNPFMAEGSNSIYLKTNKNGKEEKITIASNLPTIQNLSLDYIGQDRVLAYEYMENEESKINLIYNGQEVTLQGENIQLSDGILYYFSQDKMQAYNIQSQKTLENDIANAADYTIISNGQERWMLMTYENNLVKELYGSKYDKTIGTWSEAVPLTSYGKYIRSYSAYLSASGKIMAALNLVDIDSQKSEVTDQSRIVVVELASENQISVQNAYYDENDLVSGGMLPVYFDVVNESTRPITDVFAVIKDKNGSVVGEKKIACNLDSGAIMQECVTCTLPQNLAGQELSLYVRAGKVPEESDTPNEKWTIEYTDIALENVHLSGSGTDIYLEGTVKNNGCTSVAAAQVSAYKENEEGEKIGEASLETLALSDEKNFKISLPESLLDVTGISAGNTVFLQVTTDAEEQNLENNSTYFLVKPKEKLEISLNKTELNLKAGQEEALAITYSQTEITEEDAVTWTSSNEAVAVVENGLVKAVAKGEADITVTCKEASAVCHIYVTEKEEATNILLDINQIKIAVNETKKLTATVYPEQLSGEKVIWETEDESIAVVDENGTVTGKAAGKTMVIANTFDYRKRAFCEVTVMNQQEETHEHTYITKVDKEPTCTEVGSQHKECSICGEQLSAEEIPATGHQYDNGKVTIEPTCIKKGEKTFTCSLCGEKKVEEVATIAHETGEWIVDKEATCKEAGSRYKECKMCKEKLDKEEIPITEEHQWSSWETVSEATVFAKEEQSRNCSVCEKKETRSYGSKLKPTMKLTASSLTLKVKQSTTALKVSGMANGDYLKSVTSSSTKRVKVSSVSKKGTFKLTAQNTSGTATITVKLASGLSKKITVKVQKSSVLATGISGLPKSVAIDPGKKYTLKAKVSPITCVSKITYSLSNRKIATVSSSGVIKGVKSGKAKITVRADKKAVTVSVTVNTIKATKITNVKSSLTLKVKKTAQLVPKLYPTGASDKITYTSSNTKVATVTSKGKITAKKKGTAYITIKAGKASFKCKVKVK